MKKKGFVWGLVLVLAVGLLSGCGSESAASMPKETAGNEQRGAGLQAHLHRHAGAGDHRL